MIPTTGTGMAARTTKSSTGKTARKRQSLPVIYVERPEAPKVRCPTCRKKRPANWFRIKGRKVPLCKNCSHDVQLLALGAEVRPDSPWYEGD